MPRFAIRRRGDEPTTEALSPKIPRGLEGHVRHFADYPEEIEGRLWELEREWDSERVFEANAAFLVVTGLLLGLTVRRRFLLLPAVVAGFLFQHAVQGWSPPVALLSRFGLRTRAEVGAERYALKALRGDFEGVDTDGRDSYLDAAERAERALSAALA
jgi:hypothetical protein